MKIMPMIVLTIKEMERAETACSVVRRLQYLYEDIGDNSKVNCCNEMLKILSDIVNGETAVVKEKGDDD